MNTQQEQNTVLTKKELEQLIIGADLLKTKVKEDDFNTLIGDSMREFFGGGKSKDDIEKTKSNLKEALKARQEKIIEEVENLQLLQSKLIQIKRNMTDDKSEVVISLKEEVIPT